MNPKVDPPDRMEGDLHLLLSIAAKVLVRSSDPRNFLDWIAESGPTLFPGFVAPDVAREGGAGDVFRALGRLIYSAVPLPDYGYRPNPLQAPGRNEPCNCGSGRKYKHCCLASDEAAPPLRDYNLLRHVLDSLPARRFAELPSSRVDLDAVWDSARQWRDESDTKRAIALLEPWFAGEGALTGRLEPLFDLLMDCYLAEGNDRKRKRLVESALARGDRALRSVALQRRTTMLADQGRREEAWAAFRDAQREDPGNPTHSHLEVILLASQGDFDRAGERARFWIANLERRRDPRLAELTGFLREIAADPRAAMSGMSRKMTPAAEQLKTLLDNAPALAARHRFEPLENSAGPIAADPELARAETRWRAAFPQIKPHLTATQHGDPSVWDDAHRWLGLLESAPDLWQSLDVLDDLAMAVDALPTLGPGEDLLEPILERGLGLLRLNLERGHAARFEWGWTQNRPALRLAAHLAFRRYEANDWNRFVPLAEWIISLNPNDNHGLRDILSRAYLEIGAPERVLELCARYPDDAMVPMALNGVLAALRCGRRGEALTALAGAARHCFEAVRLLLAENPKQPRMSELGVTIGGKDEAWLYRQEHRALWERDGALAWLREAWRATPRRGR